MGFKLCTVLFIARFHAVPQIFSVTPSTGSTKGATKLTIQGSGFADSAFSTDGDSGQGNKVFLYNDKYQFECPIGKDSQTSIECNTPNNMDVTEELTVKVQSNGVTSTSTAHKFTPSNDHTPKIDWLHPQVMEPNGLLTQHGDLYTRLYTTNQANFPDSPYACQNDCTVIRIWHRGSQCHLFNNTDPLNESDAIYGYSMDNEGRTSPEGKFTCKMSGGYVGNQNFTFIIDQDYGRSKTLKGIRKVAHNDIVYDLQTYAVVNSLSVAESGVNGGAKLTISGRWFDGTPENDGGYRTKVLVGGEPCDIESINDHEVVCKIPPGADTVSDGKTWYPGGRGMNMVMFDNQDSTSLDDLMAMDPSSASSVKHYNSEFKLSSSNFSAATSPGSYARGYFRPGRSSQFLFNDVGGVYFGADSNSEDVTVQTGNFSTDLVDLVAGELYPIVWHRSDTSDAVFSFEQLSTSIPVGLVDASVPEKHQLSIQVENENEVQRISFNNVPASTTYNLDQLVCLSCPADFTCKTKVKIYGHTTIEITVNDQFVTNLQSLLSSSAFAPGIVPNSDSCSIGFITLKDVVEFVESSPELSVSRSDYVAGDQTASIAGYLPLLNNVSPLAPISTHTNNDVVEFSSTLSETYCPDFFTNQQRGLSSHYYQTFENTDENGNACNWSVDYENSYCGRASSKNQHTLFNADHHGAGSEDCSKDGEGNWNTKGVFMPTQHKYLCFNYKGAVGSGFNIRYRVYGKPGEASYIKRNHWTHSEVDTSLENQHLWKHYCIDLSEKAAWWQENRDTEPTIMLQVENIWWSKNGGDFWFDNIQIASSLPNEVALTQAESERVEVSM